jgi:hypothetical protein
MLKDELEDMRRVAARDEEIKKLLAEGEPTDSEPTTEPKANDLVAVHQTPDGTSCGGK